jgi:CRP-like cAMP-binding protein
MALQSANKLLSALPAADYRRIRPELRSVHLATGEKLGQCGETRVYFPCSGVCSVRSEMEDGRRIEIAAVGNEGVLGFAAITGDAPLRRSFLQITDGFAQSMPLAAFNQEMATEGALSAVVERFSRVFLDSAMQLAACNRLHTLQERYCRWLLITSDRLGRPRVDLTLALLAGALGAKRQELAVITKTLQNLHVLEFEEDQLVIFDRQALERFACDCYPTMRKRLDNASGGFRPPSSDPVDTYPAPVTAGVVRAHPVDVCGDCGVAAGTPHRTDRECIRAIDAEMKLLIHRTQRLQTQRAKLFERRLKALRDLVAKGPTRHNAYK